MILNKKSNFKMKLDFLFILYFNGYPKIHLYKSRNRKKRPGGGALF